MILLRIKLEKIVPLSRPSGLLGSQRWSVYSSWYGGNQARKPISEIRARWKIPRDFANNTLIIRWFFKGGMGHSGSKEYDCLPIFRQNALSKARTADPMIFGFFILDCGVTPGRALQGDLTILIG